MPPVLRDMIFSGEVNLLSDVSGIRTGPLRHHSMILPGNPGECRRRSEFWEFSWGVWHTLFSGYPVERFSEKEEP